MRPLIFPQYTRSIGYGCIVEITRPIDRGDVWPWAEQVGRRNYYANSPEYWAVTARERASREARERPGSMLPWPRRDTPLPSTTPQVEPRRSSVRSGSTSRSSLRRTPARARARYSLGTADGAATVAALEAEKSRWNGCALAVGRLWLCGCYRIGNERPKRKRT
jgi:hypothetical protein